MNLNWIDWSIVIVLFGVMAYGALSTRKYTRSVADFLAANRCAGRYLLSISEGVAAVGAISVVALFEAYYKAGFSFAWWSFLLSAVTVFVSLSGWISYRYRQTRAMTLAQFLEMRYSKRFRIVAGFVLFASGTLNFGIFPAVEARFFQYFCGFPAYNVTIFPGFTIDVVFALMMAVLMIITLFFTFTGGQISVMVTGFIQGTIFNIFLCIILVVIFIKFPWSNIVETLSARPAGESMFHPFLAGSTKGFNFWFYVIQAFGIFYAFMAWQGSQGYFAAALNPQEARFGRVLASWREYTQKFMVILLPIFAFTVMHHPRWSGTAAIVNGELAKISDGTLRDQLTTTVALTRMLPAVLMGGFCIVMLASSVGVLSAYIHSWGSIFIQDVFIPFTGKSLDAKNHMKMLRWSISGVAVFGYLFSLFFPQNDYILMYFALTGTVWMGGAGAIIAGGLYWKKGTTAGAYGALIVGILISVVGFILPRIWPRLYGVEFPINSQWLWAIAMLSAIAVYVIVSLLDTKSVCDMDKLLHRGKYAIADDTMTVSEEPVRGWQAVIGIDKNFTLKDKVMYIVVSSLNIVWAAVFIVGTIYNLIFDVPDTAWIKFWHIFAWLSLVLGVGTTVWFTWGGLIDLRNMFKRLKVLVRNDKDDGTV